jgi:hypothetical protein
VPGQEQQEAPDVYDFIIVGGGSRAQLDFLAAESCDEVQGYLVGRPHPIAEYSRLVGRLDTMDEKLLSA